jgi:indolepyruvate ferredoxin oxidoreductase
VTSYPADPTDPLLDRYLQLEGRIHLTGLQALIRISLDQVRRDRKAGRRVGALYSGYPGSPLAALDRTLQSLEPVLAREDVRFVPGLNEELAAGAVCGTQLLDLFPHRRYDGVLGLWFGKAPGLDRALDVMRHANFTGISRWGGALALVGDDPACKSSSLPSHSEHALAHAYLPTLVPADPSDVLRLGRHAFALSRYAGVWVALKLASDVADSGMLVELPRADAPCPLPPLELPHGRRFEKRLDPRLLAPQVNRIEEELIYERMQAVRHYAAACDLNPIEGTRGDERIGLVTSGRLRRELHTALERLGLSPRQPGGSGLRVLCVELVYPLEPLRVREFARGLERIVVIDERRGFLEEQIRAALFDMRDHPAVCGQYTEEGRPWIARHVDVSSETLALDLAPFLARHLRRPEIEQRAEPLAALAKLGESVLSADRRRPHFCSGCPHTRSTRLPEGSVAGGGIGCHTLALLEDREIQFIGAMGSEGSPWIGLAPYVDTPHLFQNLGDGTYFHSGRLAVRACVEAGVKMTFKLLYNGVIAMTGGQEAVGMKPLGPLAQDLLSDGVRKITIVSDDDQLRAIAAHDSRVTVLARDRYEQAMRELRDEPGVTALIYDQVCSNQKAKLERRGLRARAGEQLMIQRDVCEGCGDCARRSDCGSLWPAASALGRKTQIHRLSCTDDRSCIDGDCPAFIGATLAPVALERPLWDPPSLPDSEIARIDDERFEILLVGVGSMGVVTLNALLVRAAEREGLEALHLDQTGLAQRGGRVVSHCVLARRTLAGSSRAGWGRADLCFALDPLGAEEPASLRMLDPERTHTALHGTLVPTPEMVRGESSVDDARLGHIEAVLAQRSRSVFSLPAEALTEIALGSARGANVALLGAALQRGLLPLSSASVEAAIRERGIAVEENLAALRLGRAAAHDPKLVDRLLALGEPHGVGDDGSPAEAARRLGAHWRALERALGAQHASSLRASLLERIAAFAVDLCDYQDDALAARYLETLTCVADAESRVAPGSLELSTTTARELYRMFAYKDEYEVARLLLRGPYRRWLEQRHGSGVALRYHLQPPLLKRLGLRRKLSLGRRSEPLLRLLVRLRGLRGTWLDPFGWLASRRLERELAAWYTQLLERLASRLTAANLVRAVTLAGASAEIRGFEALKTARARSVRERVERELSEL